METIKIKLQNGVEVELADVKQAASLLTELAPKPRVIAGIVPVNHRGRSAKKYIRWTREELVVIANAVKNNLDVATVRRNPFLRANHSKTAIGFQYYEMKSCHGKNSGMLAK